MRIASRVIGGVLAVTLLSQLTACGSIFYPDRRGQIDGKIDRRLPCSMPLACCFM
jgi:hypothetical protein